MENNAPHGRQRGVRIKNKMGAFIPFGGQDGRMNTAHRRVFARNPRASQGNLRRYPKPNLRTI
jgi:hypothetical protein